MTDLQRLESLAREMTGGESSDPLEAFEQWQNERAALAELFDENQALCILNRRLQVVLDLATAAISAVEKDAQMFITGRARDKIQSFREQLAKVTNTRIQSREITQRARNG